MEFWRGTASCRRFLAFCDVSERQHLNSFLEGRLVCLRLNTQNLANSTMTYLLQAVGQPFLVAGKNLYCQTAASAFLSNPNPRPRRTRTSFGKPSSPASTVTMATCTDRGCSNRLV